MKACFYQVFSSVEDGSCVTLPWNLIFIYQIKQRDRLACKLWLPMLWARVWMWKDAGNWSWSACRSLGSFHGKWQTSLSLKFYTVESSSCGVGEKNTYKQTVIWKGMGVVNDLARKPQEAHLEKQARTNRKGPGISKWVRLVGNQENGRFWTDKWMF